MQQLRQFLRDGVAGPSLGAGPRHLDQVIRELELASPGAPFAGDGDAARHHLARVRPEAISYAVFCLKKKRGLETVTGGQRLHRCEDYEAVMRERQIDPTPFASY